MVYAQPRILENEIHKLLWDLVQEIKIQPNYQMLHAQTSISSKELDVSNYFEYWDINRSTNPG